MWSDWLVVCDCGFSLSALWCPLSAPTVLLGFLLPWTWGSSSPLLQQSTAAAPTLDMGYLLSAAPAPHSWSFLQAPERSTNSERKWTGQSWSEKDSHSRQQTWLSMLASLQSLLTELLLMFPSVSVLFSHFPPKLSVNIWLSGSRTRLHSYLSPKRTPRLEKTRDPGSPYL